MIILTEEYKNPVDGLNEIFPPHLYDRMCELIKKLPRKDEMELHAICMEWLGKGMTLFLERNCLLEEKEAAEKAIAQSN